MTAYATRDDVTARAGVLQDAWGQTTKPSLGDIDTFIAQSQAELDARIASMGFAVPVNDPVAAPALAGIVADKALLLALEATWPGGNGPAAVSDLVTTIKARITAYDDALMAGNLPALLYLASTDAAGQESGASDFWSKDGEEYEQWVVLTGLWPRSWMEDPWGVPSSQQPAFRRDERF